MLIVVSPAKTLDYQSPLPALTPSQPRQLEHSALLIEQARKMSAADLSRLMKVSDAIAELNVQRFSDWQPQMDEGAARPALFAFKGDVYTGLDVSRFSAADLDAAQQRLRILSGLYGLLRPLDMMRPYRLEMGTRMANERGKDLYQFWGDRITDLLREDMAAQQTDTLLNLASQEYFGAVKPARLQQRIVTPQFLDEKNGVYKIISFHAKKARGLMAAWVLQNRVTQVSDLEQFDVAGYRFAAADSDADTLVFRRPASAQG